MTIGLGGCALKRTGPSVEPLRNSRGAVPAISPWITSSLFLELTGHALYEQELTLSGGVPVTEADLIRTPDQRVRVFVSSTLRELAAERQAVREAVTRLRLVPVMFELGARPH